MIGRQFFRWTKRTFVVLSFATLIVSNVLSITSASFHEALYSAFSHIPNTELLKNSPTQKKQRQLESQRAEIKAAHRAKLAKAREISGRIAMRTVKNVGINMTSMAAEVVPYLGAAVVVAVTVMDVKDGCDTVRDVNDMIKTFEMDSVDDQEKEVCGIKVPSLNNVMAETKQNVTQLTQDAKANTVESARNFQDALGGTLYEMLH